MKRITTSALIAIAALLGMLSSAQAVPVSVLAMKVTDSAAATANLDAYLGWTGAGGHNEALAGATALTNNGIDYKNSFVDTNWGDVLAVRVAMWSNGAEQAFIEFDAAGTTKTDFFTQANITASTWSDAAGPGNFFSIAGDAGIDRHWFVNNNYGGCGSDVGHMVVLDRRAGYPCAWENSRTGTVGAGDRGFLYSTASTEQNWNSASIGVADMFTVTVVVDEAVAASEPAALGLLALSSLGVIAVRRRRTRAVSTR